MAQIIVATHGNFAKGIMDSIKLICGEQENVTCYCAYVDGDNEVDGSRITADLIALLDSFPADEEIIVLADLLGGSVCNEFIKLSAHRPFHLIAGLNLALLMEIIFADEITKESIEEIIGIAQNSISYVNNLVEDDASADEFDSF